MVTRFTKSGSSARFGHAAGLPSGALPQHGGLDSGNRSDLPNVTQCLRAAEQTDSNERHASVDASRFLASVAARPWDVAGGEPRVVGCDPAFWGERTDSGSLERSDIHWTGGVASYLPRSLVGGSACRSSTSSSSMGTSNDDGFGRAASINNTVFAYLTVIPLTLSATLTGRNP